MLQLSIRECRAAFERARANASRDGQQPQIQQTMTAAVDALAGALLYERSHGPQGQAGWTNLLYDGGPNLKFFAANATTYEMLTKPDLAEAVQQLCKVVGDATGRTASMVSPREALAHAQSLLIHQYERAMFEMGIVGIEYFQATAALCEFFPRSNGDQRGEMIKRYRRWLEQNGAQRHMVQYDAKLHAGGFLFGNTKLRKTTVLIHNSQWHKFVECFTTPATGLAGIFKPEVHVQAYAQTYQRYTSALAAADAASMMEQLEDVYAEGESKRDKDVEGKEFHNLALDKIFEGTAKASANGTIEFDSKSVRDIAKDKCKGVNPSAVAALMTLGIQEMRMWAEVVLDDARKQLKQNIEASGDKLLPHCDW